MAEKNNKASGSDLSLANGQPYKMTALPNQICKLLIGKFRRALIVPNTLLAALMISECLLLASCDQPKPPPPPSIVVSVFTVTPSPVQSIVELPGRVQAVRTADVRARVDGIVERRVYTEGSDVLAGQTLFRIDPRERQADYESALAGLERSSATAINAQQVEERYRPLVQDRAVSKQEYDAAVAQLRTAQADVANARAVVDHAHLLLSYTNVTAPISGRVGRAEVTEGALVSATSATLITRIEQLDPIYVNFSQSSGEILDLRRRIISGAVKLPNLSDVGVSLTLEDGTPFGVRGHLDFANMAVDESTGTVSLRAEFPNPARLLLPGMFVRARIEAGIDPAGIKVPQPAVAVTEQGAVVMMLGSGDKAEPRPVKLGQLEGADWVITSGLRPGEKVIVDGLQKVRPGSQVVVAPPGPTIPPPHTPPEGSPKPAQE